MRTRIIILLVIVALLIVGSAASAQSNVLPSPAGNIVNQGTASGGNYHLASTSWQVSGVSSGGGYHLAVPFGPGGTGTPCCCIHLPCVMRKH